MPNIAAIDVGSNAIRMAVSRLNIEGGLETLEKLRLPVRLGQDACTAAPIPYPPYPLYLCKKGFLGGLGLSFVPKF